MDAPSRARGSESRGVIYAVADGVSTGGMGDWASDVVVQRLRQFYERDSEPGIETLTEIIGEIDWELRGQEGGKAACTLAAIWVHQAQVHLFQVGDSHVFRVRGEEVHKITKGDLESDKGLNHFLGMGPAVAEVMYTVSGPVQAGDVFVLATDGVTGVISADDLPTLWARCGRDPAACAEAIMGSVARGHVDDDATVLVAMVLG